MASEKMESKNKQDKARILLVDDHPIVRQGLSDLINSEKDLIVCAQAEDGPEAMKAIRTFEPDMAIVDIALKHSSGIELIKNIKSQYPDLPILTLSMHDESLYAERALRAGAKGYIMKHEATKNVITAIHKVLDGQLYLSDKIATRMVYKLVGGKAQIGPSAIDCLSDRELEVFLLIGQGHGTSKIADKLRLSVKTVETYRAHIKEKLGLADAAELLQYAVQWVTSQEASSPD